MINNEFWFKTGVAGKAQFICINKLVNKITSQASTGILAYYALTGSDSTSYFSGNGCGKGEALTYYLANHATYKSMHKLDDSIDVSAETIKSASQLSLHCITKEM